MTVKWLISRRKSTTYRCNPWGANPGIAQQLLEVGFPQDSPKIGKCQILGWYA